MALVTIRLNDTALRARLQKMQSQMRADLLEAAATSGALLISNQAKENLRTFPSKSAARSGEPIWKTGHLARSIHVETSLKETMRVRVRIGTDVEYGRRVEFGFAGADARGRVYNQPANPYLRPAWDSQRAAAVAEAGLVISQGLTA